MEPAISVQVLRGAKLLISASLKEQLKFAVTKTVIRVIQQTYHIAEGIEKSVLSNEQILAKKLVLSFVGSYPESAAELHKQIKEECKPTADLETVQNHLTELASDHFILSAEKPDGTAIY